jgi:hypothetical protein
MSGADCVVVRASAVILNGQDKLDQNVCACVSVCLPACKLYFKTVVEGDGGKLRAGGLVVLFSLAAFQKAKPGNY